MSVEIFSSIYNGPFKRYLLLSKNIGPDVRNQSETADAAFQAELRYIEFAEHFKKPVLQNVILNPVVDQVNKTMHYICTDPNMGDHINVVAQSITALLWFQQEDPVTFLEDVITDANAYTDILLIFFKDEEPHTEWVEAWLETLSDLSTFVRRRYPKGLTWKGETEGPDSTLLGDIPESQRTFDHNALFREINKGDTIQKVLHRVNTETEEPKNIDTKEATTAITNKIFIQEGTKWRIEHYKGSHKHLTIDKANTDNVVYIYDCCNTTIVIERKINVLKIDTCENICVIFRSLISGVEIIGCKDIKLHAFGTLPSMNLDVCSDINVHLTRRGLDTQVITTQCSKISLSYPLEDGYYKTFYIPNRLITTINANNTLKTIPIPDE